MSIPVNYLRQATLLDRPRGPRQQRVLGVWEHPDFQELMAAEQAGWKPRLHAIHESGDPYAAGGMYTAPFMPNTEPVANLAAVTGVTAETNLYTPATSTNAVWSVIPQGSLRAGQALRILACGIITSSAASQTVIFTSRIGTSTTPSSNQSLGATGAIALGSTITNALWWYEAHATVRSVGTAGTIVSHANIQIGQQAAGSVTSVTNGLSGNTVATVDTTVIQGYVVSVTPSATGVSVTMTQFMIAAFD